MSWSIASSVPSENISTNDQVRGWYTSKSAHSPAEELLREAYENAKSIFTTELTADESKRLFLHEVGSSGIEGVCQTLAAAKTKYEEKSNSKAKKWLSIFSGKVMFYAGVLDVLVQHHPEYVSLVWGAMRLLFAVCIFAASPLEDEPPP